MSVNRWLVVVGMGIERKISDVWCRWDLRMNWALKIWCQSQEVPIEFNDTWLFIIISALPPFPIITDQTFSHKSYFSEDFCPEHWTSTSKANCDGNCAMGKGGSRGLPIFLGGIIILTLRMRIGISHIWRWSIQFQRLTHNTEKHYQIITTLWLI